MPAKQRTTQHPYRRFPSHMGVTQMAQSDNSTSEIACGGGNETSVKLIAAAQPLIWEQAQAATQAWEHRASRTSASDPPTTIDLTEK